MALHCDLRVAADGARFGMPLARLGLMVPFELTCKLIEVLGTACTKQFLLMAQPIDAIVLKGTQGVAPLDGTAQSDGSFAFDRVAPGDYTAEIGLSGSGTFEGKVTVPVDGSRSARIVIPELRPLSARLRIDETVPAGARPVVTVRFAGEGTQWKWPVALAPSTAERERAGVRVRIGIP